MDTPAKARPASPAPTPNRIDTLIDSSMLFGSCREVVIVHQGEHYRLRITRQDKLLLTK